MQDSKYLFRDGVSVSIILITGEMVYLTNAYHPEADSQIKLLLCHWTLDAQSWCLLRLNIYRFMYDITFTTDDANDRNANLLSMILQFAKFYKGLQVCLQSKRHCIRCRKDNQHSTHTLARETEQLKHLLDACSGDVTME